MYLWIGRINIIEITILPQAICRFYAISIKITETFFIELKKNTRKYKRAPNISSSLSFYDLNLSSYFILFYLFFGHTVCFLGSPLSQPGSSPGSQHWKHRIVTTCLPGSSQVTFRKRYHASWFQNIQQSCSRQNPMVLAWEQTQRSII